MVFRTRPSGIYRQALARSMFGEWRMRGQAGCVHNRLGRMQKHVPWLGLAGVLLLAGCETGVDASPEPGVLRITLEADPVDTEIVVVTEPVAVSPGDRFNVTTFQGKAFRDSTFFVLFRDRETNQQADQTINVLAQAENGSYERFVAFESHLPPGNYDRFQFGLTASELALGSFAIPVRLAQGAPILHDFHREFEIMANEVTEIRVRIRPLASVVRFRNAFLFDPEMEITDIRYGS